MCGIVGYRSETPLDSAARWTNELSLHRACKRLAHRGPDGHGTWLSEDGLVGLGHRRLAVNGGDNAVQPIECEDGSVVAVVNGEFYDKGDAIRSSLMRRGHHFRSCSDSELAVHLYEEHGLRFVDHLRGEFAILIWDARHRRMVAVRDRFGIKPLVYARSGDQFWFASQVCALAAAGIPIQPDEESIWHAMSFQYTLPDRTTCAGIRQLPPGHLAVCSGESLQVHSYWDLDYPHAADQPWEQSDDETLEAFGERFDEAVRLRMRGDVPVTAHLSGGIDSASVLESAIRQGNVARVFTVGFQPTSSYDESVIALAVAETLRVACQIVAGDPASLMAAMPAALDASEGWCVNGHLPAKYLLNQAIHDAGYKVSLTGEGGDELLAGYPHLRVDYLSDSGSQFDAASVWDANPASRGIMLPQGSGLDVSAVARRLGYVPAFLAAKASLGRLFQSHLRHDFLDQFAGRDPYAELVDVVAPPDQLTGRERIHQSLYLWNKTALPQYILRTLGDGCESAHAIEGRLPMLDHELFQWVKRLPMRWLLSSQVAASSDREGVGMRPLVEKQILRRFASNRVPADVVSRPKHPFVAPPLSDAFVDDSSLHDQLVAAIGDHPWFDPDKIQRTLSEIGAQSRSVQIATDPLWWMLLSTSPAVAQSSRHGATTGTHS